MLFSSRTPDAAKIAARAQNIHQHTTHTDVPEETGSRRGGGASGNPWTVFSAMDNFRPPRFSVGLKEPASSEPDLSKQVEAETASIRSLLPVWGRTNGFV